MIQTNKKRWAWWWPARFVHVWENKGSVPMMRASAPEKETWKLKEKGEMMTTTSYMTHNILLANAEPHKFGEQPIADLVRWTAQVTLGSIPRCLHTPKMNRTPCTMPCFAETCVGLLLLPSSVASRWPWFALPCPVSFRIVLGCFVLLRLSWQRFALRGVTAVL
jgi:hypothetical protein